MGLESLVPILSAGAAAAGAAGILAWAIYARCNVSVPPNRALVLYGRKSRRTPVDLNGPSADIDVRPPRIVVGSGAFISPWNRGVGRLSLDPVSVDVSVRSLHALGGTGATGWEVRLRVQAKIPAEPVLLSRAAENVLGKTDEEIQNLLRRTVEAAVPAVVSHLRGDSDEPDWDRLGAEVQASVAPDLLAWGFVVQTLSVIELRRIAPANPSSTIALSKPNPPPETFANRNGPSSLLGGLESRLAQTERNLALVGAVVSRMYQEVSSGERSTPVSVLDFPLGSELPGSVVTTDAILTPAHESMEGDRSPPIRPLSVDSRTTPGGAEPRPPLE
jgi:hypothetical protein